LDEGYIKPKVKKMSFLKIKNLSVDYPMRKETVYAAKGVNIEVNKGEILGLSWRVWFRKKYSWKCYYQFN
jgi:ABC-type antimicrobial peptide transport system ATPase subunit